MADKEVFDFLIVGAGCAGASGAMYATRLNLKAVMVAELPGGLITTTHLVENWPGIKSITGPDLASSLVDHALSFGVPLKNERVTEIVNANLNPPEGSQSGFIVKTAGNEYLAKTVLIATGTKHRKLGAPGEKEFENKGVSYCALCDGAFYKGKVVCVVGGGDSAAKEALVLSEHASKVYIIVRRDVLRAEPVNADRVKANGKIEVLFNTQIEEILGSDKVEKIHLKGGNEMAMDGVFMAIGHDALSALAGPLGVDLNDKKEIKINRRAETNVPGVYAAGDVTDTEFKQAITGSAEAVTAAFFAFDYIGKNKVVF
ncbi:FAD-dependent oxidoreductase [Patescibacteria group bacterium]|nr:FAD-dependent oxidoreductase [Patescibacteria group bacterium]MBU1702893.1 FAD-dependent oxidoreductase [Patescibacteria group bacterium]MBU1954058.1 FAD-dependent oxidoreductase [Patescibacteria group bacterium]